MSFDVETKEVDRCPSNSQQNRVEWKALHFVHVLSSSFNFIWRVIDYFSINTFSCIEIDLFIKHLITAENHRYEISTIHLSWVWLQTKTNGKGIRFAIFRN